MQLSQILDQLRCPHCQAKLVVATYLLRCGHTVCGRCLGERCFYTCQINQKFPINREIYRLLLRCEEESIQISNTQYTHFLPYLEENLNACENKFGWQYFVIILILFSLLIGLVSIITVTSATMSPKIQQYARIQKVMVGLVHNQIFCTYNLSNTGMNDSEMRQFANLLILGNNISCINNLSWLTFTSNNISAQGVSYLVSYLNASTNFRNSLNLGMLEQIQIIIFFGDYGLQMLGIPSQIFTVNLIKLSNNQGNTQITNYAIKFIRNMTAVSLGQNGLTPAMMIQDKTGNSSVQQIDLIDQTNLDNYVSVLTQSKFLCFLYLDTKYITC